MARQEVADEPVPTPTPEVTLIDASVEDAVRLGADAVGYTLYAGSPSQDVDIAQCGDVRRETRSRFA